MFAVKNPDQYGIWCQGNQQAIKEIKICKSIVYASWV